MELDNDGSDGCTPFSNANAMVLKPVFPGDSGEGLPYAPENWPNPGDIWKWKVGKRKSTSGFYQDRYLYLPDRLRSAGASKHRPFPSKPPVREYIRKAFPNADVNAFFASFTWRIPWADKIDLHLIKGLVPIILIAMLLQSSIDCVLLFKVSIDLNIGFRPIFCCKLIILGMC